MNNHPIFDKTETKKESNDRGNDFPFTLWIEKKLKKSDNISLFCIAISILFRIFVVQTKLLTI